MPETRYRVDKNVSSTNNSSQEKTTNGLVTTKKASCSPGLHDIKDVPGYLRYNPYVKCGYRQQSNFKQCCSSLFFLHNETVNIYTHGLAGLLMLFWIPNASPPSINNNQVLYAVHYIGCLSPFLGSTIYHLFMCHNSGANTYNFLLKFDMCGIWAINAVGGITAIKATLFCSTSLSNACVSLYIAVALVLLYFVLTAKSAKQRFLPLIPFGIVRYTFLAIRGVLLWQNKPCGGPQAIVYYILMDLAAFFGGILNITRFPERYFPNKLDFYFNSHNLMHVLVSLCPVLLHWGTMLDFNFMATFKC